MLKTLELRLKAADPYVVCALAMAALVSFYGIWWGWVESWNPDEMAFRNLFAHRWFEPDDFQKPPFHTYVNFVLSVAPFKIMELAGKALTGAAWNLGAERLWWSRLIQVFFFLGIVYASYRIARRSAGVAAARIVALIAASSAGLVVQTHFLTADEPVTFWMLMSFYAAQSFSVSGRTRTYVLAGLLVGVATATKYNGLAVGLALPIFHFLAQRDEARPQGFWGAALDRRLVASVAMVPVGFVAANPYSILDFRRFSADFAYNYAVTPVYGGGANQYGFVDFILTVPDIAGWPVTIVVALGVIHAMGRLRNAALIERATIAAAFGVFLLYFLQFGRAPRIETRFVVPVVPFLLIAGASLWSSIARRYANAAIAAASLLIAYNLIACYWVGKRFAEDPRMEAQAWVAAHAAPRSTFESSQYTPHWNLFRGVDVDDVRMPSVSGRAGVLSHVFGSNESMMQEILRRDTDAGVEWYAAGALELRHPQFVALDSKYFDRFLNRDIAALDYPQVRDFMVKLLAEQLGYRRVFDRTARSSPSWLYPADIDFLDNRIVILRRNAG
jgi:hypothetical protein